MRKLFALGSYWVSKVNCKLVIAFLYLKLVLLKKKARIDYLRPLDSVLILGGYTFIIWKCRGIYKVEIEGAGTLPGNERKFFLPLVQTKQVIAIKFYGINGIINRTLSLDIDKVDVKDQSITNVALGKEIGLDRSLEINRAATTLKIGATLQSNTTVHNFDADLETPKFKVILPEFKLSNYQN